MGAPDGIQHFAQRDGTYCDSIAYDLLARDALDGLGPETSFSQEYGQDCLIYAYLALDIRSEAPIEADAGVVDAGGADAGAADGGSVDGGSAADGGPRDVGAGIDAGGPTTGTTGGCGCSVPRGQDLDGAAYLALASLALAARRRRR